MFLWKCIPHAFYAAKSKRLFPEENLTASYDQRICLWAFPVNCRSVMVYDLAAADREFDFSEEFLSCEGGVGRKGGIFRRSPSFLRIEKNEVGGSSFFQFSTRQVIQPCRVDSHLFQQLHQGQMARTDKRSDPQRQGCLKSDDPAGRGCDGALFLFTAVGRVIRGNDVDRSVRQSGDDRRRSSSVRSGGFIFARVPCFRTASSVRVKW